ncbi:uncharacterized protein HD556DRAFT_1311373 [Suillus plorans]|uniref:CxC1-like cysteine cluster associated with KDZ transposases domain-containing protein n=1 Tax=Suillus plorans TaxID=116603 RepID=A0A9P7DD79_9AGAM|nr:uncharacterized protein HD556DRAFT_1311373 [Suillus plorans]KAG1789411.1 hypothetical protein HD556DRAFT_1311373 [Suillus plorans]
MSLAPSTPGKARLSRKSQVVSSGLGHHFVSLYQPRNRKKSQIVIELPGAEAKWRRLLAQMEHLMNPEHHKASQSPSSPVNSTMKEVPGPTENIPTDLNLNDTEIDMFGPETEPDFTAEQLPSGRRISPDKSTDALYHSWSALIPTLVKPQVQYTARTHGQPLEQINEVISACVTLKCAGKRTTLICLFFDRFSSIDVFSCNCSSLAQVLVHHGLFPTAPSQPRMAVSIDLLSFYRALFERSCDAINALASALKTYYSRRGFQMMDKTGESIREPFRRSLGHAVQWFDILQIQVEHQLESLIQQCRYRITQFKEASSVVNASSSSDPQQHLEQPPSPILRKERCPPLLVQ